MPVRDQVSFNLLFKAHTEGYGGLEASGGIHGRTEQISTSL